MVLDEPSYKLEARAVGLDAARLWRDVEKDAQQKWLETHAALAKRLGSKGIPSLFVNGRHVRGARTYEVLKQMVDEEIATAKRLMRERRIGAGRVYETLIKGGATTLPTPPPLLPR